METETPETLPAAGVRPRGRSRWFWLLIPSALLLVLLGWLLPRTDTPPPLNAGPDTVSHAASPATEPASSPQSRTLWSARAPRPRPSEPAEITVARKVSQFARNRRAVLRDLAAQLKLAVPPEVERFFDAAESGQWDAVKAAFEPLNQLRRSGKSEALNSLWGAIQETYGVAEVAREWPAQHLLDYGQAILSSLRPGMVYVGGTDSGRFIPTLLNETSDGERHIILTQNALADSTYLDYLNFLYRDRMATLTPEDSQRAFQEYIADVQKRLLHDQQAPNEPKQLRPGENVQQADGRTTIFGQVAVMGVNEKLFQRILEKNPNLSFALEESFPLKSTYADAVPLGPIMELRVQGQDAAEAFQPENNAQTLDYWRQASQQLLAEAEPDSNPRKAWSKLLTAQANLFVDHHCPAEAEQAFRLATELCPFNPEVVFNYVSLLAGQNRFADAQQVAEAALQAAPDDKQFASLLQTLKQRGR